MKRTMSLVLALVLILTNAVVPVYAETADNDLLSKACAVFPEYTAKLLGLHLLLVRQPMPQTPKLLS